MSEWSLVKFDDEGFDYSVRITSPEGFEFVIVGKINLPTVMVAMTFLGKEIAFSDSTRVLIAQDGTLHLVDKEPWTNDGFFYGDRIGTASGLAGTIAKFLQEVV